MTSSTRSRTAANVTSPGRPTAMPSAIVDIDASGDRVPGLQRGGVRRGALGLHADHPRRPGACALTAIAMPAEQPAAAAGTTTVSTSGACSRISSPHGALTGHDVGVVEGVDQDGAGLAPANSRASASASSR